MENIGTKRIIVYVDGYNVFHAIKRHGKQFFRLNYKALANQYLEEHEEMVEIKYFTALFSKDEEGVIKHMQYINALQSI